MILQANMMQTKAFLWDKNDMIYSLLPQGKKEQNEEAKQGTSVSEWRHVGRGSDAGLGQRGAISRHVVQKERQEMHEAGRTGVYLRFIGVKRAFKCERCMKFMHCKMGGHSQIGNIAVLLDCSFAAVCHLGQHHTKDLCTVPKLVNGEPCAERRTRTR